MIKAVFFDWFNTLAQYSPPREELQSQALHEFGIDISGEKLFPALLLADKDFFDEYAVTPMAKRSREEQIRIYTRYEQTLLEKAGVDVPENPETILKILMKAQKLYEGIVFVLFDDVIPSLKGLKEQGLILGLVTNMETEMRPLCKELGLGPYLDFVVTSGEVGADKPQPPIFLEALRRAGVGAAEALHVGDQFKIDAEGARNVGINAVLLDRYDQYPEITEVPRIKSLFEVAAYTR